MKRGDVVILDFPFSSGTQGKVRPALIVQNDRENAAISKTIVAIITGNLRRANHPTHCLIDPGASEGATSNLHGKSLVNCTNLYTVDQASVKRTIGSLSQVLLDRVDICLREALGLSTVRGRKP